MKIVTYENVKIERELVYDKNDKLEELFRKVNDQQEEEGYELFLGEEIWLSEDVEDNYNENVSMVSHFKVDGVLEILCVGLGR